MPVHLGDPPPRRPSFRRRPRTFALGALVMLAGLAGTLPAVAQEGGGSAALKTGAASFSAGKYDNAVRQLSAAINADTVAPQEAAKALYLRGMAYRKLNQPSRAIADLGAAMWLGLPASDRLIAQVNRALAYRAAGLDAQAESEIALARKSDSNNEIDTLLAENGGAANAASIAAFSTEVRSEPPSARASAAAPSLPEAPPTRTADASANWSVSVASEPEPRASSAPKRPPPAPAAPPAAGGETVVGDGTSDKPAGGNRLSRWFNSFGNPSAEPAAPSANDGGGTPAASGWTTQTEAHKGDATSGNAASGGGGAGANPPPQARTAEAKPAAPAPAAAPASGYRLQLTASRSEEEARQLWQQIASQHKDLAGHEPLIEKTDIGNLGTFYRLQIGPFPDKAESLKLCNALKQSGVDCFLVMR